MYKRKRQFIKFREFKSGKTPCLLKPIYYKSRVQWKRFLRHIGGGKL